MKKTLATVAAVLAIASAFCVNVRPATAQSFTGFINPCFSAYVAEGSSGTIVRQKTVYDFSEYTGKYNSKVSLTAQYTVTSGQGGARFVYPVVTTLADLDEITITANGETLSPKIYYGEQPLYAADRETDTAYALSQCHLPQFEDGTGILYVFETSDAPLEISFTRNDGQAVFTGSFNQKHEGPDGYRLVRSDNATFPCRMFATEGELPTLEANVGFTKEEISYKEYIDSQVDEFVEFWEVERMRDYVYSRFDECRTRGVLDSDELMGSFDRYVLCLLEVELPEAKAETEVTVRSFVEPMINANFGSAIYMVRTVTPYPAAYAYTVEVKTSESLPYIIESDLAFENNTHVAQEITDDSYFIVGSEKAPMINNGQSSLSDTQKVLFGVFVLCVAIAAGALTNFIIGLFQRKQGKK